jgi:hypothetical protein
MLQELELPEDHEPTGQAAQTADEGAATTDDIDPAEHGVQWDAPVNA